jgi:hypothetical protein
MLVRAKVNRLGEARQAAHQLTADKQAAFMGAAIVNTSGERRRDT